ncbi:DNA-3-methyladenine glycosylase family protein, partial [Acidiphilium sp.]|uniref:DNA-3-methyladenine glycosylase family protein n=1 Tax=Acidiphilium sp. TaxID=527 RepID=UPI0038D1D281
GRLVAAHGARLDGGGPAGLARVFPEPAALLQLDAVALGMPRARARTIETLAAAALRDPGLFRAGRSLDETVGRLVALPGIGEWTAHYIALRAAREPDAFPASDAALLRVAARLTGTRPNPADLAARAEAWRPWRAYAAQHLWAADAAHHARAASAALAEGDDDGT